MEKKLLTETELEFMTVLWKKNGGTVSDVLESLPADRKLAYTSVATILRILEQKKILKSEKQGRGHFYTPVVGKEEYEGTSLDHLVNNVFEGRPLTVVKHLIETNKLSKHELDQLKDLLLGDDNDDLAQT